MSRPGQVVSCAFLSPARLCSSPDWVGFFQIFKATTAGNTRTIALKTTVLVQLKPIFDREAGLSVAKAGLGLLGDVTSVSESFSGSAVASLFLTSAMKR